MTYPNASTDANVGPIEVKRSLPPGSNALPANFESQQLVRRFELAISSSATVNELFLKIARIVCEQTQCLALWASQADQEGQFSKVHSLTDESANAVWQTVSETGKQIIHHVQSTRQICSSPLAFQAQTQLVATPINSGATNTQAKITLILIGCFSCEGQSLLRLQWLMGMVGQAVTNWFQARLIEQSETKQRSLVDALTLVKALDETNSESQAAMVVVNQVRRLCHAEQVALTMAGKLVGVSDVEQIESNNEANKVIESACNQAVSTGHSILLANENEESLPQHIPLDAYRRANRIEACLNVPLITDDGRIVGGLLIGGASNRLNNTPFVEYIDQVTRMISGHLDVVLRANQGVTSILRSRAKAIRSHKWRKYVFAGVVALTLLMATPMPYRVACDCELQPVLRRFVSAPHAGILERTLAENGDIVSKDQLLAQMDGRILRIELSGLQAEYAGAKKKRDLALAQGDIANSQIARSEMKRHEARIRLLEQRTRNLEVCSPIDGIVVSGDLHKVEGAPLEMGQTLFEVAPLDQMISEIAIPESEIQYVKAGQEVSMKLSAFPFKTWAGTIKRIHPRAEIVDDESVFVAEVALKNDGVELRPGMKGSAKIQSGWAPLGWNLFHRPWETVRYWTIW